VENRTSIGVVNQDDLSRQQGVLNVNCSLAWAAVAAGTLQFLLAAPLLAQVPGGAGAIPPAGGGTTIAPVAQRSAGTNVAVIDISLVFEHYPKFQHKMTELKKEVEAFEGSLRGDQESLVKLRDNLQGYAQGSAEFKRLEEQMAKAQSEAQVKMALKRKEFLEREARVYYDAYTEVYDVVAAFSDRFNIKLVLRFNSEEMKPEDRSSVLQGVNRAVVFQRNLNITNSVIKELGGEPPQATVPGSPPVGTARNINPVSPGVPRPQQR
jgi:Skp family chaperone for outer membrane proteins